MFTRLVVSAVVCVCAASQLAQAQCGEPAADSCWEPRAIPGAPGTYEIVMDVHAATQDVDATCAGNIGHTVWFRLIPEVSGLVTVTTCHPHTSYDTVVQVWQGAECEFLSPVDCVDDSPGDRCDNGCSGRGSTVEFGATAGASYYIEVGSYNNNSAGCDLCLGMLVTFGAQCGVNPTDVWQFPYVIPGSVGEHYVEMDVTYATGGDSMSCHEMPGHTVWFEVTPEVDGPITFSTCTTDTTYDTVAQAWLPSGEFWVNLGCQDDAPLGEPGCDNGCSGRGSILTLDGTAGVSYLFKVGSYNGNSGGCTLCLGVSVVIEKGIIDCNENGVPDAIDIAEGTSRDCNDNGIPDECEPDDDGDTIPDDCDVCPGHDDRADDDGDGVPNGCDICPGYDDVVDSDSDTVPDGCDRCPGYDDRIDTDEDTVPDGCDICPGYDDGIDDDGDGVPNGCDVCEGFDDAVDSDFDGIPDGCDAAPVFTPDDQVISYWDLQADSVADVKARIQRGIPTHVEAVVPTPGEVPDDPVIRSVDFLDRYRPFYRLPDPANELYLNRIERDGDDWHLFYGQHLEGIPVYGAEIAVHLDRDSTTGTNGRYLPDAPRLPAARIAASQAEQIALAALDPCDPTEVVGRTRLMYFSMSLFTDQDDGIHLAWRVNVKSCATGWLCMVDAHTGDILFQLEDASDADRPGEDFDIETVNNNSESSTCWILTTDDDQWFDEDGVVSGANPDQEGWNVYGFTHSIYHFFYDHWGRKSYDNDEEDIEIYLDVRFNTGANAHYSYGCDIFEFWDNYGVLDVLAHEYTHAVTHNTCDLIYADQPGALNESMSDVFGTMIEHESCVGTGCADYTIGEDIPGGPFRSMEDPPLYGDPDHMLPGISGDGIGYRSLPAGVQRNRNNDWGGVHTNSSIPNKVFYLLAEGDTHNGLAIDRLYGTAYEPLWKVRNLYYHALVHDLTANSQFVDLRNSMVNYAKKHSPYPFSNTDVCSIINAWASVGIGSPDTDCDGILDTVDTDDDGDGIPDSSDNCRLLPNSAQTDTNSDGQGDDCDTDDDGDGILDDGDGSGDANDNPCRNGNTADCDDNCRTVWNPNQADSDGYGWGDACRDDDWDGVYDPQDNCPDVANAGQANNDGDSLGDACDPDDDNDGILDDGGGNGIDFDQRCTSGVSTNCDDNCPYTYNPGQQDADSDGVGDACDTCVNTPDSTNLDTDGDGQGDVCDADDDNDGVPDGQDNCPKVHNPDQSDLFGTGVGDACRQRIYGLPFQAKLGMIRFPFPPEDHVIRIPIGPCGGGSCPDYLSDRFVMELILDLPIDLEVDVVNDQGQVVHKAHKGPSKLIRFHPKADTFFMPPALPGRARSGAEPFYGTEYTLVIYPSPEVVADEEYPVRLWVRSGDEESVGAVPYIEDIRTLPGGDVELQFNTTDDVYVEFSPDPSPGGPGWTDIDGPVEGPLWSGAVPLPGDNGFFRLRLALPQD